MFASKLLLLSFGFLAALPSSSNYKLHNFGFGSGGGQTSSSNYSLRGISGEQSGATTASTNNVTKSGEGQTNQANVPPAPTFTNPSNYYNKLHFVINQGGNPSDTKYAIAIATDANFTTTNYVQSDNTVGATLGAEDYQTYANWGSGSGEDVIGLAHSTTYYIKVKAMQGNFTETGYGPSANAATVAPSLTFDVDVDASDIDNAGPFTINFGDLLPGSVTDAPKKIWVDFATNGETGGTVYVYAINAGLKSNNLVQTIAAATGDLSALSSGFGAQSTNATQSSGGPISAQSPYNGSSQNVGITDTTIRPIYVAGAPIVGGRAAFLLKAKAATETGASNDYTETITVVASASF